MVKKVSFAYKSPAGRAIDRQKGIVMKSDVNGCSTCAIGKEQYEEFELDGKTRVQYDYRHTNGKLFSCVAKTVDIARNKRDAWLLMHDYFGCQIRKANRQ